MSKRNVAKRKRAQQSLERSFSVDEIHAMVRARPAAGAYITNLWSVTRHARPISAGPLGNGIKWDAAQPALQIGVTVSFIQSCTFDMTVFGRTVV